MGSLRQTVAFQCNVCGRGVHLAQGQTQFLKQQKREKRRRHHGQLRQHWKEVQLGGQTSCL